MRIRLCGIGVAATVALVAVGLRYASHEHWNPDVFDTIDSLRGQHDAKNYSGEAYQRYRDLIGPFIVNKSAAEICRVADVSITKRYTTHDAVDDAAFWICCHVLSERGDTQSLERIRQTVAGDVGVCVALDGLIARSKGGENGQRAL